MTKSFSEKVFDISKKGFDFIDDAYNACRGFLPKTPFLTGFGTFLIASVSFCIHFGEAAEAISSFVEDYKDRNTKHRIAKLLTGGLIIGCALSGVGLAVTYAVNYLSTIGVIGAVAVSGFTAAMIPILLPGLLLGIYGLYLARKCYLLHHVKKDAKKAKDEYISSNDMSLHPADRAHEIIKKSCAYQTAYKEKLEAEKEVAFSTLEVTASTLVATGVALSSAAAVAAVLGLSVMSFGVVPMALMATGVAIGIGSKIFESFDGRKEGKYTQGLRNFFRKSFSLSEDDPMKIKLEKNNYQSNPRSMADIEMDVKEDLRKMQHIPKLLPRGTLKKVEKAAEPSFIRKLFVPNEEANKELKKQLSGLYNSPRW